MKTFIFRYTKYLFCLLAVFAISQACKEVESIVPDVPVNFTVNLNLHNELRVPGNSVLVKAAGFGGVIIYCELEGQYAAYDAACTHEVNSSCSLEISGVTGTCKCCESVFVFVGGDVSKGPATAPLKRYNTSLFGTTLRVYN